MKALLMTLAMLLVVAPAMAMGTQNYSQDFESYEAGTVPAETFGGSGNGPWNVVASSPLSGNKAIVPAGPNDLRIPYSDIKFVDGTVASIDTRIDSTVEGSYFAWNVLGAYNTPFAGLAWYNGELLIAQNGYGWDFTGTSLGTMSKDVNYHLTATFNFTNQTIAYGVNDIANPANSFSFTHAFGLPTTGEDAAGAGFYLSGPGGMYDNLSVTSPVPEPSALVALATGLMGVCGFSIRRRK